MRTTPDIPSWDGQPRLEQFWIDELHEAKSVLHEPSVKECAVALLRAIARAFQSGLGARRVQPGTRSLADVAAKPLASPQIDQACDGSPHTTERNWPESGDASYAEWLAEAHLRRFARLTARPPAASIGSQVRPVSCDELSRNANLTDDLSRAINNRRDMREVQR